MKYLLDTNTSSYIIKGSIPQVRERLKAVPMEEVCISVITEAELHHGLAKNPSAHRLKEIVRAFIQRIDVLPWTSEVAEAYGMFRVALETKGKSLASMDMLIASHALALNACLVTSDRAFYSLDYPQLQLIDWTL